MAATVQNSMQFLQEMLKGEHNLETDNIKVALMNPSFSFDPNVHGTWADCSANEIDAGNGYTAGGQALATVGVSINTTDDRVELTAGNPSWTANAGTIATTGSAIVYNDTHINKTTILHIQFTATYDTPDGKIFQINLSDGLRYFYNYMA